MIGDSEREEAERVSEGLYGDLTPPAQPKDSDRWDKTYRAQRSVLTGVGSALGAVLMAIWPAR